MKTRAQRFRRTAVALLLILLLTVAASCASAGQRNVSDELSVLSRALREAGYTVDTHEQGSSLLADLTDEMNENLEVPADEPLDGYLFAHNDDGEMVCEVFIFSARDDAPKLVDLLEKQAALVDGVSELRRDGRVVYIGLIEVLDELEKTKR